MEQLLGKVKKENSNESDLCMRWGILKKGKIFENLGKNLQNFKIFWKRAGNCIRLSHADCSYLIDCKKRPKYA